MDPFINMELFYIIWMFVLPILAIFFCVAVPVWWFGIVPKVARMLTWNRFRPVSFHMLADDTGYMYLLPTTEELPEGVVKTKKGYRFLPRPTYKKPKKDMKSNPSDFVEVEKQLLRKFIWKEMGKPIWLGSTGKVAAVNPTTLTGLHQSENSKSLSKASMRKADEILSNVKTFLNGQALTKQVRREVEKMLKQLQTMIHLEQITYIDPTTIKEVIPQMYTPSQLDALATNRELKGMKRVGKDIGKLVLGGSLIIGLVIVAIILLMMMK